MGAAPDETLYQPKKLAAADLRAPVTPALRRLPPAMRDELQQARARLVERVHPWGTTRREERRRSVLAGAVVLPLAALVLSPLGFWGLMLLVPLGAAYGLLLAELKPPAFGSGAALVLVLAVAHVATGVPLLLPPGASGVGAGLYFLFAICRLTIFFCVGMMLMVGRWHVGE